MSYPILELKAADEAAKRILDGEGEDQLTGYVTRADGPNCPEQKIRDASTQAREEWARSENPGDLTLLEAFMASRVHRALAAVPVEVLHDFRFWRYLALFPFRWYLQLREPELQAQDYGGSKPIPDDPDRRREPSPIYQLLLRTYLWGKIAHDPDEGGAPYRRATVVNDTKGSVMDVWHSHLVRIQLGQLGRLPHAFLDSICSDPLANGTDPARLVEKRLTRMKHSVLFDVHDLQSARMIADEQKVKALKWLAENPPKKKEKKS